MAAPANLPLQGLIVVAIEQAVAAPFCSVRLADAGARVIKIERPEGDFARGYDDVAAGQSSYFAGSTAARNLSHSTSHHPTDARSSAHSCPKRTFLSRT